MLTKLDGDARGGAALSVKAVTGKPIKFVGTGEKLDQIEPFHPSRMASRILGMGDVLTLIEREGRSRHGSEEGSGGLGSGFGRISSPFRISAMTAWYRLKSMGSITDILGMMPGMNAGALKNVQVDEKALSRTEAIILSMTPMSRKIPASSITAASNGLPQAPVFRYSRSMHCLSSLRTCKS